MKYFLERLELLSRLWDGAEDFLGADVDCCGSSETPQLLKLTSRKSRAYVTWYEAIFWELET